MYGMSLFSFGLVLSMLIGKPRTAGIISTMVHFFTYILGTIFVQPGITRTVKGIFSLIPNIGMTLAGNFICALESETVGVNATTITDDVSDYSLWIAYVCWLVDFFALFALALFLDKVLPKQYGV